MSNKLEQKLGTGLMALCLLSGSALPPIVGLATTATTVAAKKKPSKSKSRKKPKSPTKSSKPTQEMNFYNHQVQQANKIYKDRNVFLAADKQAPSLGSGNKKLKSDTINGYVRNKRPEKMYYFDNNKHEKGKWASSKETWGKGSKPASQKNVDIRYFKPSKKEYREDSFGKIGVVYYHAGYYYNIHKNKDGLSQLKKVPISVKLTWMGDKMGNKAEDKNPNQNIKDEHARAVQLWFHRESVKVSTQGDNAVDGFRVEYFYNTSKKPNDLEPLRVNSKGNAVTTGTKQAPRLPITGQDLDFNQGLVMDGSDANTHAYFHDSMRNSKTKKTSGTKVEADSSPDKVADYTNKGVDKDHVIWTEGHYAKSKGIHGSVGTQDPGGFITYTPTLTTKGSTKSKSGEQSSTNFTFLHGSKLNFKRSTLINSPTWATPSGALSLSSATYKAPSVKNVLKTKGEGRAATFTKSSLSSHKLANIDANGQVQFGNLLKFGYNNMETLLPNPEIVKYVSNHNIAKSGKSNTHEGQWFTQKDENDGDEATKKAYKDAVGHLSLNKHEPAYYALATSVMYPSSYLQNDDKQPVAGLKRFKISDENIDPNLTVSDVKVYQLNDTSDKTYDDVTSNRHQKIYKKSVMFHRFET
ncbi:hypothetical protein OZX69_01445 [Lactobacillus sp. ESL0731]|uniref:hypothetical protein n=1 Tax=unclassified Lactobacillus TaxID=2620435 RepID=UPI0023F9F5EC|nr:MULTISPECIES: hypothetical protein [unclassified Lactobacillus]WEV51414.1 hypothetical protein OZX63_01445 [Lactobacillus sp. ESL0700]WEV62544.1 hypothetical protein OZX69_01445 [Lactobacillus sp. ESL0731]